MLWEVLFMLSRHCLHKMHMDPKVVFSSGFPPSVGDRLLLQADLSDLTLVLVFRAGLLVGLGRCSLVGPHSAQWASD